MPPTLRFAGFMITLSALAGCATREYCAEAQFFKPNVVEGKSIPNRYFPHVAELKIHEDVSLRVSICKKAAGHSLCVEIYPAEDLAFQFLQSNATLSTKLTDSPQALPFKQIVYKVACHGPTLQDKDARCQGSNESPLVSGGDIEKRRQNAAKIGANFYYVNAYAFSPDAAFKGGTVSVALRTYRRKYEAMTETFEPPLDTDILIELPKVRVAGHTLEVPRVTFRFAKETVCIPTNRPLSVQWQ